MKTKLFLFFLLGGMLFSACVPNRAQRTQVDQLPSTGFVYLYPNTELANLYSYDLEAGQSRQLTTAGGEIYDYAVSPEGAFLVYTVLDAAGGTLIRKLTLQSLADEVLVDCRPEFCFNPVISTKNELVLFHKVPSPVFSGIENEATALWVYHLQTAEFRPFGDESAFYGVYPKWNAEETYLAVQGFDPQRIMILDPAGQLITNIETNFIAGVYDWRPGSPVLYFVNEDIDDDQPVVTLWQYDLISAKFQHETIEGLSNGAFITSLSFSPTGTAWAAGIRENAFLPSQAIWIIEADTKTVKKVVGDPSKIYSNVQWNAAGDKILFQDFQLSAGQFASAVVVWDLDQDQQEVSVADAWFPRFQ